MEKIDELHSKRVEKIDELHSKRVEKINELHSKRVWKITGLTVDVKAFEDLVERSKEVSRMHAKFGSNAELRLQADQTFTLANTMGEEGTYSRIALLRS